jgi:hypothetical protein
MSYGIQILDSSGNGLTLNSNMQTVVSSGRLSMPTSLNGDNTYGTDISLLGSTSYVEGDLGVIVFPFILNINAYLYMFNLYGSYRPSWFMNSAYTYYTRNPLTGVLSSWSPDMSGGTSFDSLISVYPVAFWDKLGASTFTAIRIFAAMCYEVYDQSASTYIKVYAVGSQGVEKVDYCISTRHYTEI